MTELFVFAMTVFLAFGLWIIAHAQDRQPITPHGSRQFTVIALTVTVILALVTFLAIT